jgi:hypothetical protein
MVDLSSSSDEQGPIPNTSHDVEFARKLFGDLNRDVLRLPNDGKVIILSDSDEEEEVCEEDAADTKAGPSFAVRSLVPTASVDDTDDAHKGDSPDRAIGSSSSGGDGASLPSAATLRWLLLGGALQGELHGLCIATTQILL